MSKARSWCAFAAGVGILAATCWLVTLSFPLAAAPQMVADSPGVTVDVGGAGIMHRTSVSYPMAARSAKVEGTVLLDASVDGAGNVVDARVTSGPVELRRAVLQSVLQWHFMNDGGPGSRQVRVTFKVPEEAAGGVERSHMGKQAAEAAPRTGVIGGVPSGVSGGVSSGVVGGTIGAVPSRPTLAGRTVKEISVVGLTEEAQARLLSRLPVKAGDVLTTDSIEQLTAAVHDYDEHLSIATAGRDDSVSFTIAAPGASASTFVATSRGVELPPPPAGVKRITIGGNVQAAKLIQKARPIYPPLAKQARIQGTVRLQAVIAADGTVKSLAVISGHPLLVAAAMEAVRQWVYDTTLLNGEPVEVITQIDVNFTLSE